MLSVIFLGGVLVMLCLQLVDLYMQLIEAKARERKSKKRGSNVPETKAPPVPHRKGHIDLEETRLERA